MDFGTFYRMRQLREEAPDFTNENLNSEGNNSYHHFDRSAYQQFDYSRSFEGDGGNLHEKNVTERDYGNDQSRGFPVERDLRDFDRTRGPSGEGRGDGISGRRGRGLGPGRVRSPDNGRGQMDYFDATGVWRCEVGWGNQRGDPVKQKQNQNKNIDWDELEQDGESLRPLTQGPQYVADNGSARIMSDQESSTYISKSMKANVLAGTSSDGVDPTLANKANIQPLIAKNDGSKSSQETRNQNSKIPDELQVARQKITDHPLTFDYDNGGGDTLSGNADSSCTTADAGASYDSSKLGATDVSGSSSVNKDTQEENEKEYEQKNDGQEEADGIEMLEQEGETKPKKKKKSSGKKVDVLFQRHELGTTSFLKEHLQISKAYPIIGLSFVTEFQHVTDIHCLCRLCGVLFEYRCGQAHMTAFKHRLRCLRDLRPQIYSKLKELKKKELTAAMLPILKDVEQTDGRGTPVIQVFEGKKDSENEALNCASSDMSKDDLEKQNLDFLAFIETERVKATATVKKPANSEAGPKQDQASQDEPNNADRNLKKPFFYHHPPDSSLQRPPFLDPHLLERPLRRDRNLREHDPHFKRNPDSSVRLRKPIPQDGLLSDPYPMVRGEGPYFDPHLNPDSSERLRTPIPQDSLLQDPYPMVKGEGPYFERDPLKGGREESPYFDPDPLQRSRRERPYFDPDPLRRGKGERPYFDPDPLQRGRGEGPYFDLDPLQRQRHGVSTYSPHPLKRRAQRDESCLDPDPSKRYSFEEPYLDPDPLKRILPSQKAAAKKRVVIDYGHKAEKKSAKSKADQWESYIKNILNESKGPDSVAQISSSYSSPKREDNPTSQQLFSRSYVEKYKELQKKLSSSKKEKNQDSPDREEYRGQYKIGSTSRRYSQSRSPLTIKDRSKAKPEDEVRRSRIDYSPKRHRHSERPEIEHFSSKRHRRSKSPKDFGLKAIQDSVRRSRSDSSPIRHRYSKSPEIEHFSSKRHKPSKSPEDFGLKAVRDPVRKGRTDFFSKRHRLSKSPEIEHFSYKRQKQSKSPENSGLKAIRDPVRRGRTDSSPGRRRRHSESPEMRDYSPNRHSPLRTNFSPKRHGRYSKSPEIKKSSSSKNVGWSKYSEEFIEERSLPSRKDALWTYTRVDKSPPRKKPEPDAKTDLEEAQADLIAEMLLTMKNSIIDKDADPEKALKAILSQDITKVLLATTHLEGKVSPAKVKQLRPSEEDSDSLDRYLEEKAGSCENFDLKSKVPVTSPKDKQVESDDEDSDNLDRYLVEKAGSSKTHFDSKGKRYL